MTEPEIIYLASPYSHDDPEVREIRFRSTVNVVATMLMEGLHVFSPICHSHPVATLGCLDSTYEFWQDFDEEMLRRCDRLVVLMLDGWRESTGVQAEIEVAKRMGMKIEYREVTG
jgi:hypothetical protein